MKVNFVSKKSISPVVATALLIVVAVISVVGFQTWFQTYSSSTFTNIEQKSQSSLTTGIEDLIGSTLYFKNGGTSNMEISSAKINGVDCSVSGSYKQGMNSIYLGNCTINGVNNIVIVTNSGVISKKFYLIQIIQNHVLQDIF